MPLSPTEPGLPRRQIRAYNRLSQQLAGLNNVLRKGFKDAVGALTVRACSRLVAPPTRSSPASPTCPGSNRSRPTPP